MGLISVSASWCRCGQWMRIMGIVPGTEPQWVAAAVWVLIECTWTSLGASQCNYVVPPDASGGMQPFFLLLGTSPSWHSRWSPTSDDQLPDVQRILAQDPAPVGISKPPVWGRTLASLQGWGGGRARGVTGHPWISSRLPRDVTGLAGAAWHMSDKIRKNK